MNLTYEKPVVDTFVSDVWLRSPHKHNRRRYFYSFRIHLHKYSHMYIVHHITATATVTVCGMCIAENIFCERVFV